MFLIKIILHVCAIKAKTIVNRGKWFGSPTDKGDNMEVE
jgi:hypothetical protein